MPRLVVPLNAAKGRFAAASVAQVPNDDYTDRLVKYIPGESVALYTFTDKLLIAYYGIDAGGAATRVPPDWVLSFAPLMLLLLGLVGTPIYLRNQRLPGQPWKLHATLSAIAFVLWAYSLGGSFFLIHHWYHAVLAGLAAPVFTFIAGAFEPKSQ
jgi:hypothetical protein